MNEIIIITIIVLIFIPVAAFSLRLHFGKSIIATLGFWISIGLLINSVIYYFAGKFGIINLFWAVPASTLFTVFIFEIIKRLVKKPLDASVNNLRGISMGHLDLQIDNKLLGKNDELGILANSIRELTEKLNEVVSQVQTNAANIATASNQLSATSQQISQGANEQAVSIEEVSSSVDEMVSNINLNSDNANLTGNISADLKQEVNSLNQATTLSLQSIQEIAKKIPSSLTLHFKPIFLP